MLTDCRACGRKTGKGNPARFRFAGMVAGCLACQVEAVETGTIRSDKMLRRDMAIADALGYVPTRITIRMGRRFNPAA